MSKVFYATIDRFVGYEFGTDGSVWSYWQKNGRNRGTVGTIKTKLKSPPNSCGYPTQKLKTSDKKKQSYSVHALILEAFICGKPQGMEACHRNGNRNDARLGNLLWGTKTSNQQDSYRHGTRVIGRKCHTAKLSEAQVEQIRRLRDQTGATFAEIGKIFGVAANTAYQVYARKTWRHV